ncbi:AraC family transcriptional regulator [Streptomyces sp. NBC_01077]|nr:AraC family transcriptional regulator [Streptomyces sp. NBC_01077]
MAARCGFTSPSHFTRRFRAAYGVTPREWRRHRLQDTSPPTGRAPSVIPPTLGRSPDRPQREA